MADRQITYLTDALIITCIVQASHADTIVKAAQNVGAQGATVTYARGTGVRERMGLMGVTIDEQKEMVRIIVSEEQADRVFEAMYLAGDLDKPGMGIMFMNKLDRIATYIPDEVLAEANKPAAKLKKRKTATRRPTKKAKMITEIGAFMVKGAGQSWCMNCMMTKTFWAFSSKRGAQKICSPFANSARLRRMTLSPYWSRTVTPPAYLI